MQIDNNAFYKHSLWLKRYYFKQEIITTRFSLMTPEKHFRKVYLSMNWF